MVHLRHSLCGPAECTLLDPVPGSCGGNDQTMGSDCRFAGEVSRQEVVPLEFLNDEASVPHSEIEIVCGGICHIGGCDFDALLSSTVTMKNQPVSMKTV